MPIQPTKKPMHPGRVLASLYMGDLTPEDLAKRLRLPLPKTEALLQGQIRITRPLANKLANLFGTSAKLWLFLQKSYDEAKEKESALKACLIFFGDEDIDDTPFD